MPVDVSALADMSGLDKNLLTLFLKGADSYSEDYIVDEVFSLKEVVDVLGTERTIEQLKKLTSHSSHDQILPILVTEKESFLHQAASATQDEHRREDSGKVERETAHGHHTSRDHSKDSNKEKEKEKEGGFLKWIFKGKKKEHSHSMPTSPPPSTTDDVPPAGATVEMQVPPLADPEPLPPPEREHRDTSAHKHKHRFSSSHEDEPEEATKSDKKSKSSKKRDSTPPPDPSQGTITREVIQAESEMSRKYNFTEEPSAAEIAPSVSRRQGATTDDDFQAIFNQFLSNN